jgi:hypothetical protein
MITPSSWMHLREDALIAAERALPGLLDALAQTPERQRDYRADPIVPTMRGRISHRRRSSARFQ